MKKTAKTGKAAQTKNAGSGPAAIAVGRVSSDERDEIQRLFERRSALIELSQALGPDGKFAMSNDLLYEKIVADLGRTISQTNQWWERKAKLYDWESRKGWHWKIDFESCDIILQR